MQPNIPRQYHLLTDTELLQLVSKDDLGAFEQLFNRYWKSLIDQAGRRLQSRERAEDLVQDIFFSLYRKRHTLVIETSLQAYLSRAMKYKVLNEFRADAVRLRYRQEPSSFAMAGSTDSSQEVELKELHSKINRTINSLPEKCRKVFVLSRMQHLSYKEISSELNITISTVEKHVVKALGILKKEINYAS